MGKSLTGDENVLLTKEIQKARLDCFIYFFIQMFGWGKIRKGSNPKSVITYDSPVSGMKKLGYPNRATLWRACSRVRKTCQDLCKAYEKATREVAEATRRYNATKTEEAWKWYRHGQGNSMSVAVRTHIEKVRPGSSSSTFFTNGYFKYRKDELLPRKEEKKRARRDITNGSKKIAMIRSAIFAKMEVPEKFRRL